MQNRKRVGFARIMRFVRVASELTLFEVSQKSGVGLTNVCSAERGAIELGNEQRDKIREALRWPVELDPAIEKFMDTFASR